VTNTYHTYCGKSFSEKHSGGIRLRSFSNHADEINIIIILVLWMKELGTIKRSVLTRVNNYTWML
jgi:hypothetical protein